MIFFVLSNIGQKQELEIWSLRISSFQQNFNIPIFYYVNRDFQSCRMDWFKKKLSTQLRAGIRCKPGIWKLQISSSLYLT